MGEAEWLVVVVVEEEEVGKWKTNYCHDQNSRKTIPYGP